MAKRPRLFNKERTFERLVENALDFLSKAISELDEHPKYSVIHFYAALELFLKARLMAEHWTLVVGTQRKQEEPDLDKFMSGDFRSVSLKEASIRLSKVVRSGVSEQVQTIFENVGKDRNKMVHFFHEATTEKENDAVKERIVRQQLKAWYFLNRLLTVQWKEVFESCTKQITEINARLRQLHDFLQVVFDNLAPEIQKRKKKGMQFRECPSCGFASLCQEQEPEIGSICEARCLVCELTQQCLQIVCPECKEKVVFLDGGFATCDCGKSFEPDDVANLLLDDEGAHYAAKVGDNSYNLVNCGDCGEFNTVVRMKDDKYICAACFAVFELLNQCHWCSGLNTNDMEDSYWMGCSMCDGAKGNYADE